MAELALAADEAALRRVRVVPNVVPLAVDEQTHRLPPREALMIPLPHLMRTRGRNPKFLYTAALAVVFALAVPTARADRLDTTIKLTVASSQPTTLAWVGAMHTLVVPEVDRRFAERDTPYQIRWTEAYGGSLY